MKNKNKYSHSFYSIGELPLTEDRKQFGIDIHRQPSEEFFGKKIADIIREFRKFQKCKRWSIYYQIEQYNKGIGFSKRGGKQQFYAIYVGKIINVSPQHLKYPNLYNTDGSRKEVLKNLR